MKERSLTTPNDFGPRAVPRSRITRNGLGARLIYKSNPFSFVTDWITPCLPFFSLQGGQDQASQDVRAGLLGTQDATSYSLGGGSSAQTGSTPTTTPTTTTGGSSGGGSGGSSGGGGDRGGIFNTIRSLG